MRAPPIGRLRTALLLGLGLVLVAAVELPDRAILGVNPIADDEGTSAGGAAVLIDRGQGLALSLAEVVGEADEVTVALPGGERRQAKVVNRGAMTGAVLLQIPGDCSELQQAGAADSSRLRPGDQVWTLGNPFGASVLDGRAARSRGVVSGLYEIAVEAPSPRGRDGSILSDYRGPVIETDAAVNDGNQGGALLDDAGRLIGLCSLGIAWERRLGTAIPVHRIIEDLGLPLRPLPPPQGGSDPLTRALQSGAAEVARGLALVYLVRPAGPGNPESVPRPQPITERTPAYRRRQLRQQWERYYFQQQVFYTDQAVTALIIDAEAGLLLTAASNLHGDAEDGFVLAEGDETGNIPLTVLARDEALDLALLRAAAPLARSQIALATDPDLHCGDALGLIGRHRDGGPFTLTTGVVSATDRYLAQTPLPFHQTDALANYGSLGGALIDIDGRVVGILVELAPQLDWKPNSGVALFVDSASILAVLDSLRAGEDLPRDRIVGLGIQSTDTTEGVRIQEVLAGSGAADAGLLPGDLILAVDGQEIIDHTELKRHLVRQRAGHTCTLRIQRQEKRLDISVELRLIR